MKAVYLKFTRNLLSAFFAGACLWGPSLFAQTPPASDSPPAAPVPGDRWLEIDLYWFEKNDIAGSVGKFWDRFTPLYAGVHGYRGVMLNIGWTVSCVMEWSGDPNQAITLPHGSGQFRWVPEKGPLTGTTEERHQKWVDRFAHPVVMPHQGYDAWTYGDVRKLTTAMREEAARRGISDLKLGFFNYAWDNAYGEKAAWAVRHPEVFPYVMGYGGPGAHVLDPGALLHADPRPLGALPQGIAEGTPFYHAYAAQWGSFSKACGFDAIMLRDSFGVVRPYMRGGAWGAVAPSAELIRKTTADLSALVRETKQANSKALVMMYSGGASSVADWRCDAFDLESIAKEGYLDIYVDQSWGGGWNEIGVRERDFWNAPALGWTYQLAYMLLHGAMLADTKVRHYHLVETFDAWEDWDIIHTAPQRLRWGMWAYSHAAIKTPSGLKFPDGSYVSWANQGKRLLSAEDVQFLAGNLNATMTNARQTTEVLGPTAVYSRSAMQWQADHAVPDHDIKEWIDEQVGGIIKWPLPVMSITRIEWLPQVKSDLFIVQTPSHLEPSEKTALIDLIKQGRPMAIFGSLSGGIDPEIAALGGLKLNEGTYEKQVAPRPAELTDKSQTFTRNVPDAFTTNDPIRNVATREATVIYSMDNVPMLTLNTAGGKNIVVWDPPELQNYEGQSLSQSWNGDGADYALTTGVLNYLLEREDALHAKEIDLRQTMNISAWRTQDGALQIMAGNLEEGLRDDADLSRHATLVLPKSWPTEWHDFWSDRQEKSEGGELKLDLPQAASVLLRSAPR